jgi:hypothetical protein
METTTARGRPRDLLFASGSFSFFCQRAHASLEKYFTESNQSRDKIGGIAIREDTGNDRSGRGNLWLSPRSSDSGKCLSGGN